LIQRWPLRWFWPLVPTGVDEIDRPLDDLDQGKVGRRADLQRAELGDAADRMGRSREWRLSWDRRTSTNA
jgi:hypothetical protein